MLSHKISSIVKVAVLALIFSMFFGVFLIFSTSGSAYVATGSKSSTVQTNRTANSAADPVLYLKAPTPNLVANANAGVSTIPVHDLASGSVMFYLPESYYAKILTFNKDTNVYNIEFASLSGTYYIKQSELGTVKPTAVTFAADVSPYPEVTLHLQSGASITLGGTTIAEADGYTIRYIGGFLGGSADADKVFVTAAKDTAKLSGAVSKSSFQSVAIGYHEISQKERDDALKQIENPKTGDDAPQTSQTIRVILIIGIAIPALLIVMLLFKPRRDGGNNYDKHAMKKGRKKTDFDYDRNRNYDGDTRPRRSYDSENQRGNYDDGKRGNRYETNHRYDDDKRDNRYETSRSYDDDKRDNRYDGKRDNRYDERNYDDDKRDNRYDDNRHN